MSKKKQEKEKLVLESWDLVEIIKEWDLPVRKIKDTKYGYKIKTNYGYKILKKSLFEDRVIFMHQALEHLAHNGYRHSIPRLIPTKYGDIFVRHNFHVYYLTDWVEGKSFKIKNTEHIYAAAESLGEIHFSAKNFAPKIKKASRERWNELSEKMAAENNYIEQNLDRLPREFSQAWADIKDSAQEALDLLENKEYDSLKKWSMREGTLCHREYIPANLIIENYPEAIRWEHCALGIQVADLANFMDKVMPHYNWDYSIGEGILESYNSIRKLTGDELFVLGALLIYPKEFLKLIKKFEKGRVDQNKLYRKIQKMLDKEKEKEAFLDAFFDIHNLKRVKSSQDQGDIVSRMWYCLPGHNVSSDFPKGTVSCLLPLSYNVDARGNLKGEVDKEVRRLANERGIPLYPVIFSAGFSENQGQVMQALAEEDTREKLANNITAILKENNYPGVNINIDLLHPENTGYFNCFVEILSEKLRPEGRSLLVNVSAPKGEDVFDYLFLGRYADYILVELLDENLRFPGPIVSRGFVNEALEYIASYIPIGKIVGVLPVYGYRWWAGKNIRQPLSFDEVNRPADSAENKLERDPVSGCLFGKLMLKEECEVWAEDTVSIKEKESMIRGKGAAGCAFWRLGLADPASFIEEDFPEQMEFAESFSDEEDSPEGE